MKSRSLFVTMYLRGAIEGISAPELSDSYCIVKLYPPKYLYNATFLHRPNTPVYPNTTALGFFTNAVKENGYERRLHDRHENLPMYYFHINIYRPIIVNMYNNSVYISYKTKYLLLTMVIGYINCYTSNLLLYIFIKNNSL